MDTPSKNICTNCNNYYPKTYKYSCSHHICSTCMNLSLIKNDFKDYNHLEIIFQCPTCKRNKDRGTLKVDYEKFEKILGVDEEKKITSKILCLKHGKESIKYCSICNKELCDKCAKEDDKHKSSHFDINISINEYRKKAKDNLVLKSFDEVNKIIDKTYDIVENTLNTISNKTKDKIQDCISFLNKMLNDLEKEKKNNLDHINGLFDLIDLSYRKFYFELENNNTPIEIYKKIGNMRNLINMSITENIEVAVGMDLIINNLKDLDKTLIEGKGMLGYHFYYREGLIQTENVETLKFNQKEFLSSFSFLHNKEKIIIGGSDNLFKVYQKNINENNKIEYNEINLYEMPELISEITYLLEFDDERFITGDYEGLIKIWEINEFKIRIILAGHTYPIRKIIKIDFATLISCADDFTIKIWDLRELKFKYTLNFHEGKVNDILYNDGKIISCSYDKTIRITDYITQENEKIINCDDIILCMCLFNDGKLICGGKNGKIYLYNEYYDFINSFDAHNDSVLVVKELSNGKIISGGRDNLVKIFNRDNFECVKILSGHKNSILNIIENDDGKIITVSSDKTMKTWTV